MHYRPYDRIEQKILGSDTGSIRYRWEWGRYLITDDDATGPGGRLRHGKMDELVSKARAHGSKLSRSEIKYRKKCAETYPTEPQISQILGQFDNWWSLISAGFPPVDLPPDAPEDAQPYDPRAPHKKLQDAEKQLGRILNSPEAHGQDPLPGLRMYLPGFTPDTIGRETLFREAFKIHRYICDEVTPQLRNAVYQAESDDRERGAKLEQLFLAAGRKLDATLGEGDDAMFGPQ
jgi:hypothetical protein